MYPGKPGTTAGPQQPDPAERGQPEPGDGGRRRTAAAWFAAATRAVARRLPFGLSRIVPPNLVGYAAINGTTFAVDLTLLTVLHGLLHIVLPAAFTVSYLTAFTLSYVLNRMLNFRSHAAVGGQLARYIPVISVNYLAWILGVGDGLTALGLDYRVARIVSGAGEAVYMYCAMRWVVFRESRRATS